MPIVKLFAVIVNNEEPSLKSETGVKLQQEPFDENICIWMPPDG